MQKSTGQPTGSYKPWFNSECKKAVKTRQNAMDKCRINPTSDNINEYKNCQANARKIIKENKKKSWHEYVSKLNVKTPAKKVWGMIRTINGIKVTPQYTIWKIMMGQKKTRKSGHSK